MEITHIWDWQILGVSQKNKNLKNKNSNASKEEAHWHGRQHFQQRIHYLLNDWIVT